MNECTIVLSIGELIGAGSVFFGLAIGSGWFAGAGAARALAPKSKPPEKIAKKEPRKSPGPQYNQFYCALVDAHSLLVRANLNDCPHTAHWETSPNRVARVCRDALDGAIERMRYMHESLVEPAFCPDAQDDLGNCHRKGCPICKGWRAEENL